MEQKSCKIFINIVFFVSLLITIFSGNKVYGVTESQKLKEIETDINYNYYNVNECGSNYNRELIVSENGGQNVYGCVPIAGNPGTNAPNMVCSGGTKAMVPTTTNSYVWICRASKPSSNEGNLIYAANVSSAFYDTLIDAEGCRNAASKIVTFNGSKNIKGCMYDGQEGFATCPSDSKENLLNISDNYGSVYSFKICTKNSTDSGDSPNQEETTTNPPTQQDTSGGSTTQKKDEIHELTCVYEGKPQVMPYPLMIKQDKDGKITTNVYKEDFIGYNGLSNDKWSSYNYEIDLEHTKCAKDGKLHCCPRYVQYTDLWKTARPVDKKKWYKADYKLIPELSTINYSSINDYFHFTGETGPRNDYDNVCNNEGAKNAIVFIGKIIVVALWVVPLIIIVLGMVDFTKAMMSNDEKAVGKATSALIKRIVAGLAAFVVPTLILAILKNIGVTKYIEQNADYTSCMNCLLYPYNNCVPDTAFTSQSQTSVVNSLVNADSCNNSTLTSVTVSDQEGEYKTVNGCMYDAAVDFTALVNCPNGAVKTNVSITDKNGDTFKAAVCSKY